MPQRSPAPPRRMQQVLPTSNRTALIEMVPNAPSIHALKSKSPPGTRWVGGCVCVGR